MWSGMASGTKYKCAMRLIESMAERHLLEPSCQRTVTRATAACSRAAVAEEGNHKAKPPNSLQVVALAPGHSIAAGGFRFGSEAAAGLKTAWPKGLG
jgi:hypothetical protein